LGCAGAVLTAGLSEAGGCRTKVRNPDLAQALSNRGRRGRKKDFVDCERLIKRLVSGELTLSFVPTAVQRLWRTVTRTRYQLTCHRTRLQNQLEALLEEAHLKLSSLVSDLLGVSARRMLEAVADGATDPAAIAELANQRLRATAAQLRDALGTCRELNPVYRRLIKLALQDLQLVEQQIDQLDQEIARLLHKHQAAVERLAEVPGLGIDSAHQIIAEVGAKAETFESAKKLASWVGACPGEEESAGVNRSARSPKGNRHMRCLLNQCANAAVKRKGSIFEILYRRLVLRLGHKKTIGAIAHRLCQLIWMILHQGVRYEERGPAVSEKSKRARTARMIRTLQMLGYRVELSGNPAWRRFRPCFFVISHERRRILRCNVTRNPNTLWVTLQLRETWEYAEQPQRASCSSTGIRSSGLM